MKYAPYGFAATLVLALICALLLAPCLVGMMAEPAGEGGGSGAYSLATIRAWPAGGWWLIPVMVCFAILGAGIVWLAYELEPPAPPEPDLKAERRQKAQTLIAAINRRGDLSTGQKESFESSAMTLADADDPTSARAAELVGAGDAVVAAKGLARDAEEDFLQLLRHSANIALPYSDRTARKIEILRDRFAHLGPLAAGPEAGTGGKGKADDGGNGASDKNGSSEGAGTQEEHEGRRTRLDVVWD